MEAKHELADAVARCVLDAFDDLPAKRKPRGWSSGLPQGQREWVPLAGIVIEGIRLWLVFSIISKLLIARKLDAINGSRMLSCVSLATGMKCLPENRLSLANGNVLHDCHAEILAIRAFNRYLMNQVSELTKDESFTAAVNAAPLVVERATTTSSKPFRIRDTIHIHMYCSEAPCGDASMELIMSQQDDPTPWTSTKPTCKDGSTELLLGRGYFSDLGVVRRKPSRPDAPPTLSKSCSDKLALKQCTSMLSSVAASVIDPANAFLSILVLPQSQIVHKACQRAFGASGRLKPVVDICDKWSEGYTFKPFSVVGTSHDFAFSRQLETGMTKVVPSNLATIAYGSTQETLINGVLQGRKQLDPKGASSLSRRRMWEAAVTVAGLSAPTYNIFKRANAERSKVKDQTRTIALQGWVQNTGDAEWTLE